MNTGHLVSVTLGEFINWYNHGELMLSRDRLIEIPLDSNNNPTPDSIRLNTVRTYLPQVDIEDEHNIIFALLNLEELPSQNECPLIPSNRFLSIPFNDISNYFPITQRGATIIKSRLEPFSITPNAPLPLFEEMYLSCFFETTISLSSRGGGSLLEILVENNTYIPSEQFRNMANDAITNVEKGKSFPLQDEELLSNLFCYSRHEPQISDNDIGFLVDLGKIIKKSLHSNKTVESLLKTINTIYSDFGNAEIAEYLSDEKVLQLFNDFKEHLNEQDNLQSYLLFLKWKSQTQKADLLVIEDIGKDIQNCLGKVTPNSVEQAIWLMGFYWGFNRFAKEYYVRRQESCSFIKTLDNYQRHTLTEPFVSSAGSSDTQDTHDKSEEQNLISQPLDDKQDITGTDESVPDEIEINDPEGTTKNMENPLEEEPNNEPESSSKNEEKKLEPEPEQEKDISDAKKQKGTGGNKKKDPTIQDSASNKVGPTQGKLFTPKT